MKLFQSHSALLFVLIVGLVWSEQLEQDEEGSDLEAAESAFHIDPKFAIFAGLAGIGALVVKGAVVGAGAAKLLLFSKHAGQGSSHSSNEWDSSSSVSYSSRPAYPAYKSYSSSYSSSHASDESKPTSYSGSLKVSGSLSPVSSESSPASSAAGTTPSSSTVAPKAKTSLSLDDVDDPLPEN